MPHITLEYSANVASHHDIAGLVDGVHDAALRNGLPPLDALRTRAVSREHYKIANGDPDFGFVAIIARIGPGRSSDDKTSFMTDLIDAAEQTLAAESDQLAIAFSVEVQEIDAEFRINRNHVRRRMQDQQEPQE